MSDKYIEEPPSSPSPIVVYEDEDFCICETTNENCVIRAIYDWIPSYPVLCHGCFLDSPIEYGHDCLHIPRETLLNHTYDQLKRPEVISAIFIEFINNGHIDSAEVWRDFLLTYDRVINDHYLLKDFCAIMLEKDYEHGVYVVRPNTYHY